MNYIHNTCIFCTYMYHKWRTYTHFLTLESEIFLVFCFLYISFQNSLYTVCHNDVTWRGIVAGYNVHVKTYFWNLFLLTFRVTASTGMNDTSSRSHAIFTINFTQVSNFNFFSFFLTQNLTTCDASSENQIAILDPSLCSFKALFFGEILHFCSAFLISSLSLYK